MNTPNLAHVAVAEFSTRENLWKYKKINGILEVLPGFGDGGATATDIAIAVGRHLWEANGYDPKNYNPDWHAPTVQCISQNLRKLVACGAVQRTEFITGRTLRIELYPGEFKDIPEKIVLFNLV